MEIQHDWQVQPIQNLISAIHRGKKWSDDWDDALNNVIEQLEKGNQKLEFQENVNELLELIVKEAISRGHGRKMRFDEPQEYMKAAAMVYYDNTGNWHNDIYLGDKYSIH